MMSPASAIFKMKLEDSNYRNSSKYGGLLRSNRRYLWIMPGVLVELITYEEVFRNGNLN